jgi:hypothetical protein
MAFDPDAYLRSTTPSSFDPDAYLAAGAAAQDGPPTLAGDVARAVYAPYQALGTLTAPSIQGAFRGATAILDVPGQLANLVTGRSDPTLGQTVRGAVGSAQERVGAITGLSPAGTRYQYNDISELPPEERLSARAGEAFGSALPFIGAIGAAARNVPIAQTVERALLAPGVASSMGQASTGVGAATAQSVRQMVADAASNPAFLRSQIPASVGASGGAFLAELVAPGSELAQMAGQFGGGMLGSAVAAGAGAGTRAASGQYDAAFPGTERAQQAAAGRQLAPILQQAGEAPEQIIQRLQTPDIVPGALPAELAQSRGITGVQRLLAQQDPELANLVAASRERVGTGIQTGVREAFEPGAPEALTQAAAVRQRGFMQRLDDLASSAERKGQSLIAQATEENAANIAATRQRAAALGEQAESATAPISPITPMQARAASRQAYELGESAMKKARADERKIWGVVEQQKDTPLPPVSFVSAYNNLRTSMLPEDTLPGIVDRVAKRFKLSLPEDVPGETSIEREARLFSAARQGEGTKPINAGELLELRSLLLDQSRNLRAQSNFKDANRVNTLADAVLDDLSQLGPSVAAAREFSKELNDRFSRGFMGDILGTKSSGAPRVRPELTLETATSAPPPRAAAQLGEMRTAVAEQGPAMQAVQQDFLRTLTTEIIDPATGSVLPKKVDGFLRRNAAILEQFPDLRNAIRQAGEAQRVAGEATAAVPQAEKAAAASLKEAEKVAEKALKDVLKQTGDAARQAEKTAAFARILEAGEQPERAIAKAVASANPVRDLTKLSTLALRGGKDATAGLRASTLKYAMDDAMKGGDVSYGKLSETLTDALSNRGESVLQVLQRNKIMTPDQRSQVEAFIKRGIERELADLAGVNVKTFGSAYGKSIQIAAQVVGANAGSAFSTGGGASMQTAGIMSGLFKSLVTKLPADKVNATMARALKSDNPEELIRILEAAAAYTPRGTTLRVDSQTREALVALRALLVGPGTEDNMPPGGAAAFRPEMLGRR